MKAEKSTELLRHIRRAQRSGQRVDVSIPHLDHRSQGRIKTHNGDTSDLYGVAVRCIPTTRGDGGMPQASSSAWYGTRDIQATHQFGDEVQFYDPQFTTYVERLLNAGISVTVAGLDLDSDGNPFGSVPRLLALATRVEKLTAVCGCGRDATRTHCRVPKEGVVLVGANEYDPMCLPCWSRHRNPAA